MGIRKGSPEWEKECDEVYRQIVLNHKTLRDIGKEMFMSHATVWSRVQWIKETRGLEYIDISNAFIMNKRNSIDNARSKRKGGVRSCENNRNIR